MDSLVITVDGEELLGLRAVVRRDGMVGGAATAEQERDAAEKLAAAILKKGVATRLQEGVRVESRHNSGHASVFDDDRVRIPVMAGVAAALLVVLVGGYGAKWSWTGFESNKQLWDWMHLLLLPVALGTFPLWLRYSEHMSRARKNTFGLVIVAFAAFVMIGYLVPLDWTGFQGNTLWDWITLIVLPVTLATVQAWPSSQRELKQSHILAFSALGVAWLVTLIGGYASTWQWTGYRGNTLWDWLQLLLAPIAVSTLLIPATVRWASGDVARIAQEHEKAAQAERTQAI